MEQSKKRRKKNILTCGKEVSFAFPCLFLRIGFLFYSSGWRWSERKAFININIADECVCLQFKTIFPK